MKFEEVKLFNPECTLCSSTSSEEILVASDNINDLPGIFSVVRCTECGLERTTPLPTIETMGFYYPESYAPYSSNNILTSPKTKPKIAALKRYLGYEERLIPELPKGSDVFEFGCASGDYLLNLQNLGYNVEGQDLSLTAVEKAREKGLKVSCGPLEHFSEQQKKYDLIVGWMVIEHLHNPIGALQTLRGLINSSGCLVFSVPERKSANRLLFGKFSYDLHLPNHVHHFDRKNLRILCERAGWSVEKIRWQANSTSFLRSLEAYADGSDMQRLKALSKALRTKQGYRFVRHFLNFFLKWTTLSGRVEVTCKPS